MEAIKDNPVIKNLVDDFKGRPKRYVGPCRCGADIYQFDIPELMDYDPPLCPICTLSEINIKKQAENLDAKYNAMAESILDKKHFECRFEDWTPETPRQSQNKNICMDFAMKPTGKWILLYGPCGTAKTKMLNIMGRCLIFGGYTFKLADFKDLYDEYSEVKQHKILENDRVLTIGEWMRRITSLDVLFVDEWRRDEIPCPSRVPRSGPEWPCRPGVWRRSPGRARTRSV